MAYRRQKLLGRAFDRFGRIVDGLVDNGRVVLMIVLCFAISEMLSQLRELPSKADRPSSIAESSASITSVSTDEIDDSRWSTFREKSDGRIDTHYQCTFTDYRARHEQTCRQIEAEVAVAMQKRRETDLSGNQ